MSDRYYKNPKKSPYNIEYYDKSYELEHIEKLENDHSVIKWTKQHHIKIEYYDKSHGKWKGYVPDFLVEYADGSKEIIEIKGEHLMKSAETIMKKEAAEDWCRARGMKYRLISKF